jgi:hypothetical protein
MAAESSAKVAIIVDTAQMQQGVQTSVEGLKQMADQATVTSDTMKTKSQAMAAAAQAAAAVVSEADMKVAASTKISVAAKAELAKAMRDVRAGAGEESDAITLLAAAQSHAREAALGLAEAQKGLTHKDPSKPMEDVAERVVTGAAGYIAAAASVRALIDGFKEAVTSSIDFGEAISRAAQKTGLATQTLSVLHYGAAVTGGDFDGMAKAVSKLDKNIGEAADGNVQMSGLFKSLGLNAKALAGNTDGATIAFQRVAQVLANTEGPRRQQLAMELLGKSGADQIPTLIQVGSNWELLAKKTQDAGVMMTSETAEALEATSQRMKDLDQRVAGVKLAFTDGLTPGLNSFLGVLGHGNGQVSIFTSLGRDMISMLNGAVAGANKFGQALDVLRAYTWDLGAAKDRAKDLAAASREGAAASAALKAAQHPGAITSPLAKDPKLKGGTDDDSDGWKGNKDYAAQLGAAAVKKAEDAKLAAMVEGREKEKQEGFNAVKLDHDYWADRLNAFAKGSSQYLDIQKRITADDVEGARAAHDAIAKFKANAKASDERGPAEQMAAARSMEEMNKKLLEQADDVTRTGARWEPYNKAMGASAEIAAKLNISMQETRLKIAEETGAITPLAAAHQLAAIHTAQHTQELKILEAELAKLQAQAANAPDSSLDGQKTVDPKVAAQMQELQNKIALAKGSQANQGAQDTAAVSAQIAKPYLTAFNQINSGWLKVQNDLIQGNKRIGQDFREMGLHMVQSMAAGAEKMLADWARMELRKVMMHRLTMTQNTATDAAGAATSDSISAISAMKQATHAAGVAAGKAWSALAGIPIVGPELGAVAAAATYAGVLALAAFEKGGIVGGSAGSAVPILAHAGERVLSNSQTSKFESMVNNNSSSGGDMHFHMGGNTTNGGSAGAPTVNDKQFVKTVKRLQRQGSLAPGRQSILS